MYVEHSKTASFSVAIIPCYLPARLVREIRARQRDSTIKRLETKVVGSNEFFG